MVVQKFCKEDKSLKDEEHSGWPSEVANSWVPSSKMIILQLQEKLPNNLNVNHSIVVQHLKQTRRVKKLDKWVPHELMTNQKNHHFGVSSLILHNSEPFLGLRCVTKRISYDNQWWAAQWLDKETLKHFPKPNLHQKKVMVTFWWSAASLIHYSFLNPSETITHEKHAQQIDEMHWKLQCLQLALVNRMQGTQPVVQKLDELG